MLALDVGVCPGVPGGQLIRRFPAAQVRWETDEEKSDAMEEVQARSKKTLSQIVHYQLYL